MASRFESLKEDRPAGSGFGAFGGDRSERPGSGAFGKKDERSPFARREERGEGSGSRGEGGAFGEKRGFGGGDREGRQERSSNPAFSTIGKDRSGAPRDGPADSGRPGNYSAFGGQRKDGEREGSGFRGEQTGERRQFSGFASRGAGADAAAESGAPADPNNRFAKFASEMKSTTDEAPKAPVESRFTRMVAEEGPRENPFAQQAAAGAAAPAGAGSATGGTSFAAAAASAPAFAARPFAVRKDASSAAAPTQAAEPSGAFGGMRRGGGGGEGSGFAARSDRPDAPAAFQGMRRPGQDGGRDRDREFAVFGGGGNRQMPDAFTQGGRRRDDMRDRARADAVSMGSQTVQDRYKVNLLSLASKEDGGSGKGDAAKPAQAAAQGAAPAPASAGSTPTGAAVAPTAALAKASSLGDDVVRATFAKSAGSRLEDFLADLSKDAAKKAAADLAKLAAANKAVLAPYAADMVAKKALVTEAAAERRSLAALLNALRTGTKKEPQLCSDAEVASSVETVASGLQAGEDGLQSRIRVYTVVDALTTAKAGLAADALGPASKALLEEKPAVAKVLTPEEEEELAQEMAAAAVSGGGVSWGDAAVPTKAAGTPAAQPVPVDSQADADNAAAELLAKGKLGGDLLALATEEFVGFKGSEAAAALMTACLKAGHEKNWVNSKNSWLGKDKFRPLLAHYCHGKSKASVAALFRLQSFFSDISFPLGDKNVPVILRAFEALYQDDVIEEEPMQEWRNDMRNPTPGHDTALMQLQDFFDWLDNAEEEDEEEDEEEEMEGIVKPNNRGQLR